jgi:hypothetical protein
MLPIASSRSSCCWPTRPWPRIWSNTTFPRCTACTKAPDLKKVADFEAFITTLGYSLAATGGPLRPKHFQKLIDRMRGTPEERPIAALMLRTMQKARYDAASLGPLRPRRRALHAFHVTNPSLSGSRRASDAA